MNQPDLETPPPRKPSEPDATIHQLTWLWNAGVQDQDYLNSLGRDQARWLIARRSKGGEGSEGASGKNGRTRSWGMLILVTTVLAGGIYWLTLDSPPLAPDEKAGTQSAQKAGTPATGDEETGESSSGIIAPSKDQGLSFRALKERFTGRREQASRPARETRQPGTRGRRVSSRLEEGTDFILKKPVGVRVREGIIVLQPGTKVEITKIQADKIMFKHPLGEAEATSKDLLP